MNEALAIILPAMSNAVIEIITIIIIIIVVLYGPWRMIQPCQKMINNDAGVTSRESIPRLVAPILG
jgi:hypothetical protein